MSDSNVTTPERRKGDRRDDKDRRCGADLRSKVEKQAIGERRKGQDRRSTADRRGD